MNNETIKQKLLTATIVGKPNSGKSTLLNTILGQKLSIVSPKVQTTRTIITGILTEDDTQFILLDTPGIFEPTKKLESAMVRCAWSSLVGTSLIIILLDSSVKPCSFTKKILNQISKLEKNQICLLNKIDLRSKNYIDNLKLAEEFFEPKKIFNISAKTKSGVNDLVSFLKKEAEVESWLYNSDDLTNLPSRFIAAEITREQLFLKLYEELPYNLTVENELWEEKTDGSVKINQIIIVSRASHKNIILGKNGAMIKSVGEKSRENIAKLLGQKVHLFLFVKVRKDWLNKPENYISA